MEKRIDLERRARNANQITELNLDNCRSTSIVGLNDEYTALESLSLINVGLTTLKGFPKLPNLKKLELSDNRIPNGLNYLHTSPKLHYLNLSGNKIKDLEALKPLEEFKHLAVLDLFNNEATQIENYREKIFEMLPSLKYLDGFDCNDMEAPSEGDDEEENGSIDEDKQNAFNFNGIEIDLDELEAFEKRVKAKRKAKQQSASSPATTTDFNLNSTIDTKNNSSKAEAEVDELDEYLKTLKLKEEEEKSKALSTCNISNNSSSHPSSTTIDSDSRFASMNFVLFLYWFLAILNLASAAFYSDGNQSSSSGSEEDPASGEEFSSVDDEDVGDVSLSEVYNTDLGEEEDEDDWVEQYNEENDDDEDSDEDEANESAVGNAVNKDSENNAGGAEEPESRGKKRKHEG